MSQTNDDSDCIEATLINADGVRVGSPFVPETHYLPELDEKQFNGDGLSQWTGVNSETAKGGAIAALGLLPWAVFASFYFPLGGTMIAGLGGVLSLVGFGSPRIRLSSTMLILHGALLSWTLWQVW